MGEVPAATNPGVSRGPATLRLCEEIGSERQPSLISCRPHSCRRSLRQQSPFPVELQTRQELCCSDVVLQEEKLPQISLPQHSRGGGPRISAWNSMDTNQYITPAASHKLHSPPHSDKEEAPLPALDRSSCMVVVVCEVPVLSLPSFLLEASVEDDEQSNPV